MKQTFAKVLMEFGVDFTVDQWIVLQLLFKDGPLSQFEIAEKAFKDRPTVTRIIDLLCEKKFVTRKGDSIDRRRFVIHLTEKGKNEVRIITPKVKIFRLRAYDGLTDEDIARLKAIMDEIYSNLID